jgi:hypothetical protein
VNPLIMVIMAIAGLCGPRIQSGPMAGSENVKQAKTCQVELLKCVNSKNSAPDSALQSCILEGK